MPSNFLVHSSGSGFLLCTCSLKSFSGMRFSASPMRDLRVHCSDGDFLFQAFTTWGISFPRILQAWHVTSFPHCATCPGPHIPTTATQCGSGISTSKGQSVNSRSRGLFSPLFRGLWGPHGLNYQKLLHVLAPPRTATRFQYSLQRSQFLWTFCTFMLILWQDKFPDTLRVVGFTRTWGFGKDVFTIVF